MKSLAEHIRLELERKTMGHCAIYEDELQQTWPIDEKDRQTKIEQFANLYGFHLSFYRLGLCAIFIKESRQVWKKSCGAKPKVVQPVRGSVWQPKRRAARSYKAGKDRVQT
jgi:hypothetical protein